MVSGDTAESMNLSVPGGDSAAPSRRDSMLNPGGKSGRRASYLTGGSKSSKNAKAQPIMDGGNYARTMMQAAQKINTSVNSLYKPSHGEKSPELEVPKALDDNAQRTSLTKALG